MPVTRYILDADRNVIEEADHDAWENWMHGADAHRNRVVATNMIAGVTISTVFRGYVRHNEDATPKVFDTALLEGPDRKVIAGYPSWADARAGHALVVRRARRLYDRVGRGSAFIVGLTAANDANPKRRRRED